MRWIYLPLHAALLVCLLLLATPAAAAQPAPADIALRVWPSARDIKAGDVITLELIINNNGAGRASYARVDLEYVRAEIDPFRTRFSAADMWVSKLDERALTVEFGHMAPGEERRALIFLRVNEALPNGFRIITRATARWQDVEGKQKSGTNPVIMTIGGEQPAVPSASVAPATAPLGALLRVSAKHYFPNETIVMWLNMPDGTVRPIVTTAQTNGAGAAEFELRLADLPPGVYGLVVCGHISRITQLATITIEP